MGVSFEQDPKQPNVINESISSSKGNTGIAKGEKPILDDPQIKATLDDIDFLVKNPKLKLPTSYALGYAVKRNEDGTVVVGKDGKEVCLELRHYPHRRDPDETPFACDEKPPYQLEQENKLNPRT